MAKVGTEAWAKKMARARHRKEKYEEALAGTIIDRSINGAALIQLMSEHKVTITSLAERLGRSRDIVRRWRSGDSEPDYEAKPRLVLELLTRPRT